VHVNFVSIDRSNNFLSAAIPFGLPLCARQCSPCYRFETSTEDETICDRYASKRKPKVLPVLGPLHGELNQTVSSLADTYL